MSTHVSVIEKGVTSSCEVVHRFSQDRVIVNYDGLFILADRRDDGFYELSGKPATPDEARVLNPLVAGIGTTTTVTKE